MHLADLLSKLDPVDAPGARDFRLVDAVRSKFKPTVYKQILVSSGEFPEIIVEAPNHWPCVILAPLYDVHVGNPALDWPMFRKYLQWMMRTPNLLSWDGGDMLEFNTKLSVGTGIYEQDYDPNNQMVRASLDLASLRHKMVLKLEGNHEARSRVIGFSASQWLAWLLDLPHYSDYAMLTVRFRGNNFRILAHHGSGAAQTAGGQIMAARKDIAWARPFDIFWTGHLHRRHIDDLYQTDVDQKTGRIHERNGFVIISPSMLKYFDTYAAVKRYAPGTRGITTVKLMPDGRIDTNMHANGRRL